MRRRGLGGRELSPSYGTSGGWRKEGRRGPQTDFFGYQRRQSQERRQHFQPQVAPGPYAGGRGQADYGQELLPPDRLYPHAQWPTAGPPAMYPLTPGPQPGSWGHFMQPATAYPPSLPPGYAMTALPAYAPTTIPYGMPPPSLGPEHGRTRQWPYTEDGRAGPSAAAKERRVEPDLRELNERVRGRGDARRSSRGDSEHHRPSSRSASRLRPASREDSEEGWTTRHQPRHELREQRSPEAGTPLGAPASSEDNYTKMKSGDGEHRRSRDEAAPCHSRPVKPDPANRSRSRSTTSRGGIRQPPDARAAGAPLGVPAASEKQHIKNRASEAETPVEPGNQPSAGKRRIGSNRGVKPLVRNADKGGRQPLSPQPVSDKFRKTYERYPAFQAPALRDGADKGVWLFIPDSDEIPLRDITDLPVYHQNDATLEVVRELLGLGPHVRLSPAARVSDRTDGLVEKRTYFFPSSNDFKAKLAAPSQLNLHVLQLAHPGTRIYVRQLKVLDRRYDDGTVAWTFLEAIFPSAAAPKEVHYLVPAIAIVAKLDSPDDNLRSVEEEDGFAREGMPRYKAQTNYLLCFQEEEPGYPEQEQEDDMDSLVDGAGALNIKPELEYDYDFQEDEEVGIAEWQSESPGHRGFPQLTRAPNPQSQLPVRRRGIRGYAVLMEPGDLPPLADDSDKHKDAPKPITDGDAILVHSMRRMDRPGKENFLAENDYLPLVKEDEVFIIASWARLRPEALNFWDLRELRPANENRASRHRFEDPFHRVCQAQALGFVATAHEELLDAMQQSPPLYDIPYSWAIESGHVQLTAELSEEQQHVLRSTKVSKLVLGVLNGGEPHLTGRLVHQESTETGTRAVYRVDDKEAESVERACCQTTKRHWPRRGLLDLLPHTAPDKERRRFLSRGIFRLLLGKDEAGRKVGRQLASLPVPGDQWPARKEVRPLPPYLVDQETVKELLGHPLSPEQREAAGTMAAANDRPGNRVVLVEGIPGSAKTKTGVLSAAVRLMVDDKAEILYVAQTNEAALEGYKKLTEDVIPGLEKEDRSVRRRVRPLLAPSFSRQVGIHEAPSPDSRTLPVLTEHIYQVWEHHNQPETEEGLAAFGEALHRIKYPNEDGGREVGEDFVASRNQIADCCSTRFKCRQESEEAYEALESEEETRNLLPVDGDADEGSEPFKDVEETGLEFRDDDPFNGLFGLAVSLGIVERDLQAAVAVYLRPNFTCATLGHARRDNITRMGLKPTILMVDEGSLLRLRDVLQVVAQVGATCQSIIVLGDQRQIPPFSRSKGALRLHEQQSVLETVGNRRRNLNTVQRLLTTFRMPADINGLNNVFYDRPGKCGSNWSKDTDPLHRFPLICNSHRAFIVDVHNGIQQQEGSTFYNLRELELATQSLRILLKAGVPKNEIMIATLYNGQRFRLEAAVRDLGVEHSEENPGVRVTKVEPGHPEAASEAQDCESPAGGPGVRVKTVNTCIGLEASYVILSMVRGTPESVSDPRIQFLAHPCKLCVGASRSKKVLIMLVNMGTVVRGLEQLGQERVSEEGQDALTRVRRFFWLAHEFRRVVRGIDALLKAAEESLKRSAKPEAGFNSPYNTWPARGPGGVLNEAVTRPHWSYDLIPRLKAVPRAQDWFAHQHPRSLPEDEREGGAGGATPAAGSSGQPMEEGAVGSSSQPREQRRAERQWVPTNRGRNEPGPSGLGRGSGGPGRGGFRGGRGGRGRGGPRPGGGGY